ncbi:hypothetical protein OV079_48640 [Nannocystis pusilla]|uniref:Uncharacterized protein n=1 Tax=Nannocystis pusilla TaxID=889268 RepID=A0A9X3J4K0_9BACT|nr:hypothetical protein [Nannocystis pusilla]MCY1013273.1 hypothetical protein [Nannocystis pusilla]
MPESPGAPPDSEVITPSGIGAVCEIDGCEPDVLAEGTGPVAIRLAGLIGGGGGGGGVRRRGGGSDSGRVPWSSPSSKASRSWTMRQWPAACFLAARGHSRRVASFLSSTVIRAAV